MKTNYTIQWINHYPVDKHMKTNYTLRCPVDSLANSVQPARARILTLSPLGDSPCTPRNKEVRYHFRLGDISLFDSPVYIYLLIPKSTIIMKKKSYIRTAE